VGINEAMIVFGILLTKKSVIEYGFFKDIPAELS